MLYMDNSVLRQMPVINKVTDCALLFEVSKIVQDL